MFISCYLVVAALAAVVIGAPLKAGVDFEEDPLGKRSSMPTLTLPYGTWKAYKYDQGSDM